MSDKLLFVALGLFGGIIIYEPILINFVYFTNIDLFMDLILTPKKKEKLISHIKRNY